MTAEVAAASQSRGWRKLIRSGIFQFSAVVLVFASVIVGVALLAKPSGESDAGSCDNVANAPEDSTTDDQNSPFANVDPLILTPGDGHTNVYNWDFGQHRVTKEAVTYLDWDHEPRHQPARGASPDAETEFVSTGSFLELVSVEFQTGNNKDGGESLVRNPPTAGAYARIDDDGVLVKLCVDVRGADPGVYRGQVLFADRHITEAPIALGVTVKESDVRWPILLVVFGGFAGLVLSFLKWKDSGRPPVAAIGVGTGISLLLFLPTVMALWNDNSTWGQNWAVDRYEMFAAAVLGTFSAAAGVDVVQLAGQRGKKIVDSISDDDTKSEDQETVV